MARTITERRPTGRVRPLPTSKPDDGVPEPSERSLRTILLTILAIFGPPAVLYIYYRMMFPGLVNPDSLDYAQLARNLANGHGFTTYFLRPLALTHGDNLYAQPDLVHGPLFPFLLALAFGVLGAKDSVSALVSGIFYLLTIPAVYLLGMRIFNRKVALYTTLILIINALMLEYAASGLPITLYVFLSTCLMIVIYDLARVREANADRGVPLIPKGKLFLAGMLTGLLYLTDPVFFWFLPVIIGMILWLFPRKRMRAFLWFLMPLVVLVCPWMIRNARLTGNPIFGLRGMELWMFTKNSYPGYIAYRLMRSEMAPGKGLFNDVVRKILLGAGEVIQAFPQVTASWVLAFFLPSLLFRFTDRAANSLRVAMMLCFTAIFFGMLLFQIQMPLFVSLIPAMMVFSVAYLLYLAQQARLSGGARVALTTLVVVAVTFPLLSELFLQDKTQPLKETATVQAMRRMVSNQEAILTDQPWIVAWDADRPAIWIPADDGSIGQLRQRFPGARWLCMTDQTRGLSVSWQYLYEVFHQWNLAYDQAMAKGVKPPRAIRISGNRPVLAAVLNGFVSLPPVEKSDPSTLIAAVPLAGNRLGYDAGGAGNPSAATAPPGNVRTK